GAYLMGIDYGYTPTTADDLATMIYGRALFLLAWDGRPGSAYMFRPCGTTDPANPAWTVDIGTPSGRTVLANGLYQRVYTEGLVLLNPSRDSPVTISIPSGYVSANGTALAATATLPPRCALLLRLGV